MTVTDLIDALRALPGDPDLRLVLVDIVGFERAGACEADILDVVLDVDAVHLDVLRRRSRGRGRKARPW